jgi:hypothetical protein
MGMAWVRKYYRVPAKRGGRVEYTGEGPHKPELGTITSVRSGRLMVRLDGHKLSYPFHPTWALRYLDAPSSRAVGRGRMIRDPHSRNVTAGGTDAR